jgi:hypothetical protein
MPLSKRVDGNGHRVDVLQPMLSLVTSQFITRVLRWNVRAMEQFACDKREKVRVNSKFTKCP